MKSKAVISAAVMAIFFSSGASVTESQLLKVIQKHMDPTDDGGCAIVLNAADGKILQKASVGAVSTDERFEPGSVVSPLTVCAALDCGVANIDTVFTTDLDRMKYKGLPNDGEHTWNPQMSVSEALSRSSNIIIGKVGGEIGVDLLAAKLSCFGIVVVTNGLACRMAVGQGVEASVEDIVYAYGVIANGGIDVRKGGQRVVKKEAAEAVRIALGNVISEQGTARLATVEGVKIAGKTATAMRKKNNCYEVGKFNAMFVGIFPLDAPRYIVAVRYKTGNCKRHLGGQRPAEAFADIANLLK